jgi:hypothetical protein
MVKKNGVTPHAAIPGATDKYNLRIGAVEQRLSVGLALAPNLSLGLGGAIVSYGGANGQSAFHAGSGVAFDARPNLKVGLVNDKNLGIAVAVQGYGIAARGMGMRPAGLVEGLARMVRPRAQQVQLRGVDIAAGGRVDTRVLGAGLGLSAAKNIGKHVGVQKEVGGEASRVASKDAAQGSVRASSRTVFAGTAASVDLAPIAPVGAMVEYRMDHSVIPVTESSKANVSAGDVGRVSMHRMSAGLYYTARKNLALGVSGTYGLAFAKMPGTPSTGKPAQFTSGRLTLGYYF